MLNISFNPPSAPPVKYEAPLGTRWEKEKAAAGGSTAFDLPTDPKTIGPWILGECVGKGASGRVKIARHRRTGQLAAVKILPMAPLVSSRASLATQQAKSIKMRFGIDREIVMMKLMNHPNIMRIYDVYEGDKELFLVLEYVEGGELFDFLVNRGKFPPEEALIYFRQIVYGLNYAHTFSIIHRDLKPENILIASLSPPLIKIADWGMAAFAPPFLQLETSCGSPHYASPEIVNGERYQGNATDIWSCGVILYALLTGRLPFDDKDVRTLLDKVKSGKYEMPTCIDPMAKDLISKMLVVNVKQRITIPEILSHPWLMSQPAIPFSAYDGNFYTIFPPPLPPSPNVLARPIASSDMIDPELFSCLRIIWGRYADANGDCIRRDLCSPAGRGVYAKAFYFLLDKYRNESLNSHRVDAEFNSIIPGKVHLSTDTDLITPGGPRKYEVSYLFSKLRVYSTPQTGNRRTVLANSANIHIGPPPRVSSRKRSLAVGPTPAEKGRTDPVITATLQRAPSKSQLPTVPKDGAISMALRPKSAALSGLGRGDGARHFSPRRGNTQSMLPEKRVADSNVSLVGPSPILSQDKQRSSARTGSSGSPITSVGPLLTSAETGGPTSGAGSNTGPRLSLGSSHQFVAPKGRSSIGPAKAEDISPPTIEEIVKQMNGLVSEFASGDVDSTKEGKKSNIPLAKMRRHRNLRERSDKENRSLEENWGQVTTGITDSGRAGVGVGDVLANRAVGKEVGNLPPPLAKMKKPRPPPLELTQKKSTLTMLASPLVLSSPIHVPSSANRTMASPAVSDFKGWFSNLFSWKNPNGNGGILYSPDDLPATRVAVTRILEGMGVVVSKAQGDYRLECGDILVGRIDNPGIDHVSGLPIKNIRFRIEFRPNLELLEMRRVAAAGELDVPYLESPLRHNSSALNSPVTSAAGPLSARPMSFLLGGRSVSHGTPLPSPALVSASMKGEPSFPPGCLCAVALVYEKGSMSTFKLLWRRLKEEYGEIEGGYPCLSPAIPNTPYVEGQRPMIV